MHREPSLSVYPRAEISTFTGNDWHAADYNTPHIEGTMHLQLKNLSDQVIVITGASSGIGLTTARKAASRGARVVLAARSLDALQQVAAEISADGGTAHAVKTDVTLSSDIQNLAEEAVSRFGRIDTWVNNAGVSVYGRSLNVPIEDMRQVFEVNFWSVVYGSRIACEYLEAQGGALINLGSEVSDKAAPLQGIYSASKHAIKGWTDALRMELEDQNVPISVTLIKPGTIDTPFTQHARNYLPDEPKHVPPVYAPDAVAEAILHAATTPTRDLFVGSNAMVISAMSQISPRLGDKV